MKFIRKQSVFVVVMVFLVVGLLEGTLDLLAVLSPTVDRVLQSPWTVNSPRESLPDERLGSRPNPSYPGHDSKGFRNPRVPAKADVVALGDSNTYGANVAPGQGWPRQLEAMMGGTVYSMAWGGWGPVHSLILLDEAISLHPKIIIEAFYAGNDLYDSFNIVYNGAQFPDLKSPDPQTQESVEKAEISEPIQQLVSRIVGMGTTNIQSDTDMRLIPAFRRWLSDHSKIYGFVRRTRYEITRLSTAHQTEWENAKAFAEAHPEYYEIFSKGDLKTVFKPEYRLFALNLQDARVAEGLHISLGAIGRMKELAAERSIRFIVLLIPSKELVFQKLQSNPSTGYRALTENETEFWKITKDFFEGNRIEYVDALSALQAQLAAGVQPYPASDDGHPNEQGHSAIAKVVAAYLKR
jgi:hypothetical protein